jgi:hypothetical protein
VPEDRHLGSDVLSLETALRWTLPSEVKKLRQLEEENARLRKVVADLTLGNDFVRVEFRVSIR